MEYNDIMYSHNYLNAVKSGKIKDYDIIMQLSFDSTQLYHDKDSDC